MKNKPTPEGFKIYALCGSEYTFSFLYYSRMKSVIGVIPHLRDLKIGVCGTVRVSSKQFPSALKVDKKCKFEWDTLSDAVVDNAVLAAITGEESRIACLRFRIRTTSTNAARAREVFNGQHCAVFKIPKIIDNYNHNMNGIDLSDHTTTLNTTIVNAYRIYKAQGGNLSHREFRIELAWTLASEGNMDDSQNPKITRQHHQKHDDNEESKSIVYVTPQNMPDLPAMRFLNKSMHYPHADQTDKSRPNCILCRYKTTKLKDENFKVRTPTAWTCTFCKVPLCLLAHRNCFNEYHGIP
ncbi:hypothetical protein BGZ47_002259 [Haplosporangium gracile]|nr:hypothetical protein BGZ47_002259 [Haplosporangium gracile]